MKKLILLSLLLPVFALAQNYPPLSQTWAVQHQPAAATAATISKAATVGVRYVATSVTICVSGVAAQPSLIFNLRDGATGAGTVLWTGRLSAAAGTSQCLSSYGVFVGTNNTAMTLESAAAPAATNFATVSVSGYSASYN